MSLKEVQILLLSCGREAGTVQQEVKMQEATSVQEVTTMQEVATPLAVSSAGSLSRYEGHFTNRPVRH